ncbi:lysyl oxidase-like protein 2/3/4 [Colletotrichum simmondsii]|uniref:monoamine oxidase n=1 Tax=Colletotrichum simmondsii TaxID=703756 RepID=A0A135SB72_9PEZI|nr:lysyl oxidase-like protein 2/3/4 [Colletotrichum simmondsii]
MSATQDFVISSMVYWEAMSSFIVDQDPVALSYLDDCWHYHPPRSRQTLPCPWTGVGTTTFIYLAKTATLVRRLRALGSLGLCGRAGGVQDTSYSDLLQHATILQEELSRLEDSAVGSIADSGDIFTPPDHLIAMEQCYRLAALLELYRAFPELVEVPTAKDHVGLDEDEQARWQTERVSNISMRVLQTMEEIPVTSGTVSTQLLPLIIAGSVLGLVSRENIAGEGVEFLGSSKEVTSSKEVARWREHQPHVFTEIHRYGLQSNLKTSSGTAAVEHTFYTPQGSKPGLVDTFATNTAVQNVADAFFSIDGLSSRELMPYPHDPFRLPALWTKYDHLSAKDRLDQLDINQHAKGLFDAMISSFGAVPGSECGFTEVLRWYALGGHSMAGTFELAGMYKLGGGGMTSLARAILDDYRGHVVLNAVVEKVEQQGSTVVVSTKNGRWFEAKYCISTIPLNCLSDVTFSPPLSPLRMEAIRAGHINKGSKVHFRLAKPEPGWFSMANGYGTSPWCFAFSDHNGTADQADSGNFCIGFGYGARHIDPKASTEMITTFQNNIRPEVEVTAYLTHDWANDSLAKGTWSCWGPNSMSKWLKELQRPEGRVHFASADWADGWRGFVDGAIERGTTVGREIEVLLAGDNVIAKL